VKKIIDISQNILEADLDVGLLKDSKIKVSNDSSKLFNDILPEKGSEISLKKEYNIVVDKKKTKNFDALELQKWFLRKKWKKISLIRKKENAILVDIRLYFSRTFKKVRSLSYLYLIWLTFLSLLFVGILSKSIIENRVNSWYEKLLLVKNGGASIGEIQKNVNNARFDFFVADVLFFPYSFLPWEKINSVEDVISGGRYISKWLDQSLNLYSKIDNFTSSKKLSEIYFSQLFLNIYNDIYDIRDTLQLWLEHYRDISWLPSQNLVDKKESAVQALESGIWYTNTFLEMFPEFSNLIGHEWRKRYLIVFQNADEIRPTGWFMWSMALLELFKWQIKLFQKKDVYAIEWDLKSADYERLPAPKWISELTPTFWLRDSNYFANIEDSSNAIKFFLNASNVDIDGVVYINQNVLLKFLELTWPMYFEDLNVSIWKDNFSEVMSLMVEAKVSQVGTLGTPKQILFNFIEKYIWELLQQWKYSDYVKLAIEETKNRDIVFWSFNEEENNFLWALWMNWNINYENSIDFIYPVFTSLSWNKSDRYMERMFEHSVTQVEQSCDFNIKTTLLSSHNMWALERNRILSMIEKYDLNEENLFKIQGADRNRQYVRVILPSNAIIENSDEFEIVDYWKRKWVEFFMETPEQWSSRQEISYVLQNPECLEYDFTFYKQAGVPTYDIKLDLFQQEFTYQNYSKDFVFKKR